MRTNTYKVKPSFQHSQAKTSSPDGQSIRAELESMWRITKYAQLRSRAVPIPEPNPKSLFLINIYRCPGPDRMDPSETSTPPPSPATLNSAADVVQNTHLESTWIHSSWHLRSLSPAIPLRTSCKMRIRSPHGSAQVVTPTPL